MEGTPLMDVMAPVRKTVEVRCSRQRAFDTWTDLGRWWPLATHCVTDGAADAVFERREGGRIYEVGADGSQHGWGVVRVYDEPSRLVYSWGRWAEGPGTEVEVVFTDIGDGRTRVDLTHRGWEHLGDEAEAKRAQYESGWNPVLTDFVAAV